MKIFTFRFSSIKSKILFVTISIIVLFGLVHIMILHWSVKDKLEERFITRGILLGHILAGEIEEPLLYENLFILQQSILEWVNSSPEHAYAMIIAPDSTPIVTTFYSKIPKGLINSNLPKDAVNQVKIIYDKNRPYYDIAVPIMKGVGGFLRLGLNEGSVSSPINKIMNILIFMVLVFIALGTISAYFLSKMITKPITKIVDASRTVNLNGKKVKLNVRTGDELEMLSHTFENMIERLQLNHLDYSLANKQVYESEKLASIGYLASGIAHEIRNPLLGITNGLKRIEKNPHSREQIKKYIPVMLKGSLHIENILSGLLQYAKKDTGIISLVDLQSTIEDAISFINHRLIENKITLIKPEDEINITVTGNKQNITQVLINLMINASEAMPNGGNLTINIRKELDYIWIDISDTGIGINEDIIEKIWEPFYTSKYDKKGTGLGLAVTKSLVEMNGCKITCTSKINEGTTFSFSMPAN
jgi:signal transduction histidine kinase